MGWGLSAQEASTSDALFAATAPEQARPPPRQYQGVRVREPVKELLRRKAGPCQQWDAVTPSGGRGLL